MDFYSDRAGLKDFLDQKVNQYNQLDFIENDPISVPHQFQSLQDIEISGFFAAIFAWGIRKTAINKTNELMHLMDNNPHQFILNATNQDLKPLLKFKHRTFNTTDLLYCIDFFKYHYSTFNSLEDAFIPKNLTQEYTIELGLNYFNQYFFSLPEHPTRTQKHISAPKRGSSCKRLNMFLRWMVRQDTIGVDFGLWKQIKPHQLIIPEDVHVAKTARLFKLLNKAESNWKSALELTNNLKELDPQDPVKYDFALFGLSIFEKFKNLED